jgi:arginine decarboxylase
MKTTGIGPLVRRVLIVDDGLVANTSAAARSVRSLVTELADRGVEAVEALTYEDGLATVVSDSGLQCVLLNWTQSQDKSGNHEQATELLRALRKRNAKVPIFLMASRKLAGSVNVEVATLADEFIWILEDTASFIAGRVQTAIERYLADLLPPFAAGVARYTRERVYSWAAPGQKGGVGLRRGGGGGAWGVV